jgi:hypothetical protein
MTNEKFPISNKLISNCVLPKRKKCNLQEWNMLRHSILFVNNVNSDITI